MIRTMLVAASLALGPASAAAQIPAPPLLPGQDRLAEQLVRAIEAKDVEAYASLLSEEVKVFEDGKPLAGDKGEWLARFGKRLSSEGVFFKVSPVSASTGRLLVIEYFNSAASWGRSTPAHCCWSHDAVAYDIKGGKVTAIQRLRGGSVKLGDQGEGGR